MIMVINENIRSLFVYVINQNTQLEIIRFNSYEFSFYVRLIKRVTLKTIKKNSCNLLLL